MLEVLKGISYRLENQKKTLNWPILMFGVSPYYKEGLEFLNKIRLNYLWYNSKMCYWYRYCEQQDTARRWDDRASQYHVKEG